MRNIHIFIGPVARHSELYLEVISQSCKGFAVSLRVYGNGADCFIIFSFLFFRVNTRRRRLL